MVPVMGATAPPWAPEPLTPARYLGTGTDTWELPSCRTYAKTNINTSDGSAERNATVFKCLNLMRQVQIKVLDWRFPTQRSTSGNNLPWRIDAPRCPVSPVWGGIWPHWQNSAGTMLHLLPPGSHSHDTGPRPPDVHTFRRSDEAGEFLVLQRESFQRCFVYKMGGTSSPKWWGPAHLHRVASIFVVYDDHIDLYNTTEELLKVGPWGSQLTYLGLFLASLCHFHRNTEWWMKVINKLSNRINPTLNYLNGY